MKLLVVYDGTSMAKSALRYGLMRANRLRAQLIVLSVFNSDIFLGYEAFNAADAGRREAARYLAEAKEIIRELGGSVNVEIFSSEGDPEEAILTIARSEGTAMIIVPPRYKNFRKRSPVPVTIVPGTLLVPIDNTDSTLLILDQVIREAKEAASSVILLGVVPVHMYSRWEQKELETVRELTVEILVKMKDLLNEQGIETTEMIRSGYPDVDILKVADECAVSMIILPDGGKTPSELRKAAHLILTERDRVRMPVFLFPAVNGA